MNITFRAAEKADLPFVAWCNYEATSPSPGFCYWDPLLEDSGTDTMQFIKTVFEQDALAWGRVEDFIIGEIAGEPVCGASGFAMDEADYRPLKMNRLPDVQRALGWTDDMREKFVEQYEAIWRDPLDATLKASGDWTIECVAVASEHRCKGLGKALMHAVLETGKKKGHSSAGISVTLGNTAAETLYEAIGFKPYATYWSEYFGGEFPGMAKFKMNL
ncbi:MAG: GNAT family N-acetyltransferase [Rhizobacter sp.]|nr:GNAT family N-acetyltransferase [Chlorobiales bacterium]